MRLFASVDVDELSEEIRAIQAPLVGLSGVRTTDPADAHVTMKFLGEDEHDLAALSDAIERAVETADIGPFEATIAGVGAFPSSEYIRIIWLGVGRGAQQLSDLHEELAAETTALGYEAEGHEFTPHVTLARMENAASKGEVQGFLEEEDPEIGPLRVEELRLKESTLSSGGSDYRTVERFEL